MQLFLLNNMAAVILPGDAYLQSVLHQLGSALLFGLFLGTWAALLTSVLSLVVWLRGSWDKTTGPLLTAFLIPVYLCFMFSKEMPVLSVLCSMLTPFFFWPPWIYAIRRGGGKTRHPPLLALFAFLLLLPLHPVTEMSLPSLRDKMITNPIGNWVSDFYYNHTLLAAHVFKPPRYQTQKVIAVSKDVEISGPPPAGSLWIRCKNPCALRGRSLVISREALDCPSFVVSDAESGEPAQELLRTASVHFDDNRAIRRGIKWFLEIGLLAMLLLLVLWTATRVEDAYRRHKWVAVLLLLGSLFLTAQGLYRRGMLRSLKSDPNRVAQVYAFSNCEEERYLVCAYRPDHLTQDELAAMSKAPSPRVRHAAFLAIGERMDPAFLGTLREGLADPEQIVRTKVCQALGEMGGEAALGMLDQVIASDPSWYVRDYGYKAKCKSSPISKVVDPPP